MTRYDKKVFRDLWFKGDTEFSELEFSMCHFAECFLGLERPSARSTIRNVVLINCSQDRSMMVGPKLENVLVDGLDTKGQMVEILGAAFNRVTLRGKIDRLWIKPDVIRPSQQAGIDQANAEYYKKVEWALDISQADFKEVDIRAVPVGLIRLDPETQGIVTQEKLEEGRWITLTFQDQLFKVIMDMAIQLNYPGTVLVAEKRNRRMKRLIADLKMLRKEGIVEPA